MGDPPESLLDAVRQDIPRAHIEPLLWQPATDGQRAVVLVALNKPRAEHLLAALCMREGDRWYSVAESEQDDLVAHLGPGELGVVGRFGSVPSGRAIVVVRFGDREMVAETAHGCYLGVFWDVALPPALRPADLGPA